MEYLTYFVCKKYLNFKFISLGNLSFANLMFLLLHLSNDIRQSFSEFHKFKILDFAKIFHYKNKNDNNKYLIIFYQFSNFMFSYLL